MSNVISMGVGFIIANDLLYCLHLPLVAVGVGHETKLTVLLMKQKSN